MQYFLKNYDILIVPCYQGFNVKYYNNTTHICYNEIIDKPLLDKIDFNNIELTEATNLILKYQDIHLILKPKIYKNSEKIFDLLTIINHKNIL